LLKGLAPLSKEDVINLVNDSNKSKKGSQQVSDFSLNAEMKEKVIREMGEDKYRKAISIYQKLHGKNPENSLYSHLYTKAKSCFVVHFYNNKLSPFAVIEIVHDIKKTSDVAEIDIEIFNELQKKGDKKASIKNIVKSFEDRHEIDVLTSIDKLMQSGVVKEVEPEIFIDAIKLEENEHFEKLFKKKEKNKLFDIDVSKNLTPLMLSVVTGNYSEEIAKEFGVKVFEKGAAPVLHDYEMTFLMFASMIGNYEAVEFLLLNNVKPNLHNGNGVTALMLALENRHDDIAILLMSNRADVNAKNKNDYSALMIAAAKGMAHVVDHMIKLKVDVNHVNSKGQTALISALRFNNENIVVSLIAAGTDLNSKDVEGHTPIYYAESVVVTELIRRGARHSKQIKKKQNKKRKKKLAYDKNIFKDEKEVVPSSCHGYVFSFMTPVAVLILIYYYVIR